MKSLAIWLLSFSLSAVAAVAFATGAVLAAVAIWLKSFDSHTTDG